MVKYDSAIIERFAQKLYARANGIVAQWALLGAVVGGVLGYAAANALQVRDHTLGTVIVGAGGLIMGYFVGSNRAFILKLQAQSALCQRQIEENTRRGA